MDVSAVDTLVIVTTEGDINYWPYIITLVIALLSVIASHLLGHLRDNLKTKKITDRYLHIVYMATNEYYLALDYAYESSLTSPMIMRGVKFSKVPLPDIDLLQSYYEYLTRVIKTYSTFMQYFSMTLYLINASKNLSHADRNYVAFQKQIIYSLLKIRECCKGKIWYED